MATPVDPAPQSRTDGTSSRTLGQLVSDVSADISQIVRGELELAKLEIKQDVSHAGKGAGMLAGAAVFGLYGLGLLFLGLAGVIAIWLNWWAGLLIVAGVLFVVAAILAVVGKNAMQRVKGKPERTIDQAQQTVDTLKGAAQSPHRAEIAEPVPPTRDGATAPLR
ncbi:phage holin family protein [Ornithinimicrobium pratense]|uniref:Phage holin family protein n=1 Tax=Ornithinimicrobium pratense TaxID=2593973 RepID=A0A5J6V3Q6_9MICO|nr:phage holin family protein [Ornithinimicrobium pratense]QFG67593.1 phage holin family protein [Ornithinimicrobium pratense]